MLLVLFRVGLQVAAPQFVRGFIDAVTRAGRLTSLAVLWRLACLFLATSFLSQLAQVSGLALGARIAWQAGNRMRRDVTASCLSGQMAFHLDRTPGELMERTDGDVTVASESLAHFAGEVFGNTVLIFTVIVVLAYQNPLMGGAVGGFNALALIAFQKLRRVGSVEASLERAARGKLSGFLEERISALDDLRSQGAHRSTLDKLDRLNGDVIKSASKATRAALFYPAIFSNSVFILGFGLALGVGVFLFRKGEVSLGVVYLLVQYTAMLRSPIENLGIEAARLQSALASLRRVAELDPVAGCRIPTSTYKQHAKTSICRHAPTIEVRGVGFEYKPDRPVLRSLDFVVPAGTTLGLVGRTGSGKSTLLRVLAGLYHPTQGTVSMDGRDLLEWPQEEIAQRIAVVTQDQHLFRASVRENLTLFSLAVSDATLLEALAAVGLGAWLERLPDGLDTHLANHGGFSVGEAQLLSLARALLQDPDLILLDEPSAHLDSEAAKLVARNIRFALGREGGRPRTAVIIAHRPEALRYADQILVLERGRAVELGPPSSLGTDPGSRIGRFLADT